MPPRVRFDRAMVLDAALKVARRDGMDGVNARAIARELGCSTQPLFREFDTMDQIKGEVLRMAGDVYGQYMARSSELAETPYKGTGTAYILFAQSEPELFKALFMRARPQGVGPIIQEDQTMDYVYSTIMRRTGYTRAQAALFHTHLWIYTHGLATMVATRFIHFEPEQLSVLLSDQYEAIKLWFDARVSSGQPPELPLPTGQEERK